MLDNDEWLDGLIAHGAFEFWLRQSYPNIDTEVEGLEYEHFDDERIERILRNVGFDPFLSSTERSSKDVGN